MVAELSGEVEEIFPWDLQEALQAGQKPLLLDIRCPDEFAAVHIPDSINRPRGILEIAVDYGYEETVPSLVEARGRRVVVICRSGNRSILAANTMTLMGYINVVSLRTGLRGWNDYELELYNGAGELLDPDWVDEQLSATVSPHQLGPSLALASLSVRTPVWSPRV
jgi:rhodanese-related sulfurtransferase